MSVFRPKIESSTLLMLEKVPLFASFTEKQLRSLAQDAKERSFAAGATVVSQGENGIGFYLMLEGRVEVRRGGKRLATHGPGAFFGEMALFNNEPRSADVVALEPTRCLVLSKWEFWSFAMDQPKLLRRMLEEMARRLTTSNRALSE